MSTLTPHPSTLTNRLSLRLGLLILLVVGSVFGVSLGLMFYQTRKFVNQAAERRAMQELGETVKRITDIMDRTENATASMEMLMQMHMEPDSLLAYSRRMLDEHPDILGFTIALEPDYFPQEGRCFSAYSMRQGDSIITVAEKNDFYEQVWYKMAWVQKRAQWLEPYMDETPGFLTSLEYNYSYVKPFYSADGKPIGVLCTDLLLKWLSQTISEVKPFPNSAAIMLGHDGRYIVHPDTSKLVRHSIFSDPDPEAQKEVVPLGQAMLSGQSGIWSMTVDGQPAHVFFRPLQRTGWSIAIVCPDSDVFSSYNRMLLVVWTIISVTMLLLMIFCYQTIRHAIVPVNRLAESARRISEGHFDEPLPATTRSDTVGQLQNSFVRMQKTLQLSVTKLQSVTAETELRNQDLQQAYQIVKDADARKMEFIKDMYHEIRTPLNIINGFTQVVSLAYDDISPEEMKDIVSRMRTSARDITRLTRMLSEASPSTPTSQLQTPTSQLLTPNS